MRAASGSLGRSLEPLVVMLWVFFVVLSLATGVVWAFGIGDGHIADRVRNEGLALTLQWLLRWLDFAWIMMGMVNVYAFIAAREGLGRTRIWTAGIFLSVLALSGLSTFCGVPLGHIQYSAQLGPKIGPMPLGLPLLWLTVFAAARETALRLFPRISYGQAALVAGSLVLLTDLSLEPLAAKLRGWWFWRAAVAGQPPGFTAPLATPLVWGLVAWLTTLQLREKDVAASTRPRPWKPVMVLLIFHAVFLAAHVGRWVRR